MQYIGHIFFPRDRLEKNKIIKYFLIKVDGKLYLDNTKLEKHEHGTMIRRVLLNHTDLEVYNPMIHEKQK